MLRQRYQFVNAETAATAVVAIRRLWICTLKTGEGAGGVELTDNIPTKSNEATKQLWLVKSYVMLVGGKCRQKGINIDGERKGKLILIFDVSSGCKINVRQINLEGHISVFVLNGRQITLEYIRAGHDIWRRNKGPPLVALRLLL